MLFDIIAAMAAKTWKTHTTEPATITPIKNLTQRSAVEIAALPIILANGFGSLLGDVPSRNIVSAIGTMSYFGHTFYRIYLSQMNGGFIHVAVQDHKPTEIIELRLFRPYHEIIPTYSVSSDIAERMGSNIDPKTIAPENEDLEKCWSFWLFDDSDPMIGGLIGCPSMQSKMSDLNPETGQPFEYSRTWVPNSVRISPVDVVEQITDQSGDTININHTFMPYARQMAQNIDAFEHLIVSAVQNDIGASVNYWLGVDIKQNDLTVYPPPIA